jgi:hypothetical protein
MYMRASETQNPAPMARGFVFRSVYTKYIFGKIFLQIRGVRGNIFESYLWYGENIFTEEQRRRC